MRHPFSVVITLDHEVVGILRTIAEGIQHMANTFDDLVAQVHANEAVEASAVAAIKGLIDRIATAAASPDPAVLATAIAEAKASSDALAAAVASVPPAAAPAAAPAVDPAAPAAPTA